MGLVRKEQDRQTALIENPKRVGRLCMLHNENEAKKPETDKRRRAFFKKAAYAAPVLMVMGQLTRPTETKAGFGPPPSQPHGQ